MIDGELGLCHSAVYAWKRPVSSMYWKSAGRFLGVARSVRRSSGPRCCRPRFLRRSCRALVNRRHPMRKCSTVSAVWQYAHNGESTALMRARNLFRPTCPLRSWVRMLPCGRDKPQYMRVTCFPGGLGSNFAMRFPCLDVLHWVAQRLPSSFLKVALAAARLCGNAVSWLRGQ